MYSNENKEATVDTSGVLMIYHIYIYIYIYIYIHILHCIALMMEAARILPQHSLRFIKGDKEGRSEGSGKPILCIFLLRKWKA